MAINASKVVMKSNIEPLPIGNHMARLIQVVDLGLQANKFDPTKAPKREIMLTYELSNKFMKGEDGMDDKERPRFIGHSFPLCSLESDLAKSTKVAKALDPSNKCNGDFVAMLGSPCMLTVVHKESKGNTYANIAAVTPAIDGIPYPILRNPTVVLDLENPDVDIFLTLPKFMQERIESGADFPGSSLAKELEKIDGKPNNANTDATFPSEDMDDVPF